jgi:hypothetical protein
MGFLTSRLFLSQVKTYINGSLYSLLSDPTIRDEARAMGLGDMLNCYREVADETFLSQLDFIMKQLAAEDSPQSDTVSDDGQDADDFDEDVCWPLCHFWYQIDVNPACS